MDLAIQLHLPVGGVEDAGWTLSKPVHATEHLETPQRGSLSSVHLITPKNPLLQLSILPWG